MDWPSKKDDSQDNQEQQKRYEHSSQRLGEALYPMSRAGFNAFSTFSIASHAATSCWIARGHGSPCQ